MTVRNILLTSGLVGILIAGGGCGGGDEPPQRQLQERPPAPSPTPDPVREEFLEALRRSQRTAYRYTVRGGLPEGAAVRASGAFDPRAQLFEATIKITGSSPSSTHRIVIGKHNYLRDVGDRYWVHLDLSRVKKESLVYFDMSDPTGLAKFSSVIGSVRRTGPRAYAGRFNPESGFDPFLPVGAPSVAAFFSPVADFTATTDDQGWVTSITVELKASTGPALRMTTTMTSHGAKSGIKAPPKARVREADNSYYEK